MSIEQEPPYELVKHYFTEDAQFDRLYPLYTQVLSKRHWTPISIAKKSVQFLVPHKGTKVLDIGSGAGKFCLTGAWLRPDSIFYGVEQRKNLLDVAEDAKQVLGLENVHFMLKNFSQLDFSAFDSFYFFNSFYENLAGNEKIDNELKFSEKMYNEYSLLLFAKLMSTKMGTRVVSYHTPESQLPAAFRLVETHAAGLLKCWIKDKA